MLEPAPVLIQSHSPYHPQTARFQEIFQEVSWLCLALVVWF